MSPSIRIDEDVYRFLQEHAQPFVDTPNSVLRRLLELEPESVPPDQEGAEAPVGKPAAPPTRQRRTGMRGATRRGRRRRTTRAPAGSLLPEEEYVGPLLSVLAERGGSAAAREVIGAIGEKLDGKLTSLDREPLSSGGVRWENRVQWVRLRMVEEGFLAKDSPRGVWSLTELGRARLKEIG